MITTQSHAKTRRSPKRLQLDGVPLVIPIALVIIVLVAGTLELIPKNMIGGLAIIVGLGMILGPLGNRVPVLSKIGGGALVCLMVPSILVYFGVFNENILGATTALMKEANFLYFVIAALVVGSLIGMKRSTMLSGLSKVFVPLLIGTIVAVSVGVGVAMLFGYPFSRALFYIVVPIIGGGIGEGIIPLSAAYASSLGGQPDDYVAQLIPAAVIGNICAIIIAGLLSTLAKKRPHLSGEGDLVKEKPGAETSARGEPLDGSITTGIKIPENVQPNYALGILVICGLFVIGALLEPFVHLPAPVLVIILSVIVKVLDIFPESVQESVRGVYKIVSGYFIYPTMIGLGMLYVPLDSVVSVISIGYVMTCVSVVVTMSAAGFFVGKLIRMYPVEASIVTVCHSGLGGTGDVAVLSASNRMVLMPFAQISTRIGGVTTVVSAAALIKFFG